MFGATILGEHMRANLGQGATAAAHEQRESAPAAPDGRRKYPWLTPLVLLGLAIAMFGDVLFSSGDLVLSQLGTDLSTMFVYLRQFGFSEMRAGRIALWNPHLFGGVPFAGGFQPALFYPPNVLYLILPLAKAFNCEIALHVFLVGLFMAWWAGHYDLHPLAALLAASVVMFGAAFSLRIYAGHLAHLDAMAWVPLILLAMDGLLDEPCLRWVLVGVAAFAMQLLAGYPQVLFNTVVTCALYAAIRMIRAPHRLRTALALAATGAGAVAVSAVQLWTGMQAAAEGTRQAGVPIAFAASFSLPPENFFTLLVPGFFGNMTSVAYWGRGYWWEMTLFFGLTGVVMAVYGMTVETEHRAAWAAMVLALFAIASGAHTPLFGPLYSHVPGFDRFRSLSKFSFQALVFLAMFTAIGMDRVMRSARGAKAAVTVLLGAAFVLGGLAMVLRAPTVFPIEKVWNQSLSALAATGESFLPSHRFTDAAFLAASRRFASGQCLLSAAVLVVLAMLFWLRASRPGAAYALAIFGIAEVFVFARSTLTTFHLAATVPEKVRQFVASHPGDYRILNLADEIVRVQPSDTALILGRGNSAMAVGADDVWGYDPNVLERYAQFIAYSQGEDPNDAGMYIKFTRLTGLMRLLRLKYVFVTEAGELKTIEAQGGLPHLTLVGGWQRIEERNAILEALNAPSFDPLKTVILENDPDPPPSAEVSGSARLVGSDPNSMTIAADIARPALLLVTDTYSRYWRAEPMAGSVQQRYAVLPADYTLMAVPLAPGHHLIRLEYAPSGYVIGRWISLAAVVAYLAALVVFLRRRKARAPR